MRPGRQWRWPTLAAAVGLVLLSACSSNSAPQTGGTAKPTVTQSLSITVSTTVPPTPTARAVNWFDLDVGDCLADPPPTDPNVVTVAVVDCTTPHQAEVYVRAPLAVNTAVVDVATRKCDGGFTAYTGQPVGSNVYTTTYLIDSNQNRTAANPDPSTVICLLTAADGGPLTAPARR